MADIHRRLPYNVPGGFYVDNTCIPCGLCVATVPTVFRGINGHEWAAVFRQPATTEELALTLEAVEGCPTESIGTDGNQPLPPTA